MEIKKTIITPKMAEDLLKKNNGNRRLRIKTVDRYAHEMRSGRWLAETGESIKLSTSGNVLDGQHRLMAIVKAGIPVETLVCHGVKSEVFKVLDSGVPRNSNDSFHIKGIPHANILPSIISLYLCLKEGQVDLRLTPTTSELLDLYQNRSAFWDDIAKKTSSWYIEFGKIISPSMIGASFALFFERNTDDAHRFMKQLCSGMDIQNKAVGLLRKKLIDDKLAIRKMPNRLKLALLIKTWNYFRRLQSVKVLKFELDREDFPKAL